MEQMYILLFFKYKLGEENKEVDSNILIRAWTSDEWIAPTLDVYLRDC